MRAYRACYAQVSSAFVSAMPAQRCIAVNLKPATMARSGAQEAKMYPPQMERPFESIESAHEYMNMLAATALEAMQDLKQDRDAALHDGQDRRAQAIELAMFKLRTLNCYVHKSRRTLNDLRILRRLILNERLSVESVIATM